MTEMELLGFIKSEATKPLNYEEMVEALELVEQEEMELLTKNLASLEEKGLIVLTRRKRYALPQQMDLLLGRIQGNSKGFAFLIPEEKGVEDVFLPANALNGAWHNDRVIVRIQEKGEGTRSREGKVIRIVEQAYTKVVGTLEHKGRFGFVVPDDSRIANDIFIEGSDLNKAKDGMKVVVEVTGRGDKRRSPEGKIVEILGMKGEVGVDVLSIVRKYSLPEGFPEEVLTETAKKAKPVTKTQLKGRKDLRRELTVTIDGADAKDLDDAITLERLPEGGFRLGVHIADVGHYVPEGSKLDEEALSRGTSVYLVDRVLPMLPRELSNGICSLNAGEDRLTLSCIMDIDAKGKVIAHEICESVIRVDERMTYTAVTALLEDEDRELIKRYTKLLPLFREMSELCNLLRKRRMERGTVDFNFPESKVRLDENGNPVEVYWKERIFAEMIIEEFMICANETVAAHYYWLDIPFLYRIHEEPSPSSLADLNKFLAVFGYYIKTTEGKVSPHAFQNVINKAAGQPEERLINTVMLRSLKHARYSAEALGHFGLASKYYSHFTSPIRRYPDLAIHRVIKKMIKFRDALPDKEKKSLSEVMHRYADQSSLRELVAEDAERESVLLKKVEYMKQFEGDILPGTISSVTGFGFFVELENSIEGLVHISSLDDDFYHYRPESLSLLGENTRKTYSIGQKVEVKVMRVNLEDKQIDFELVLEETKGTKKGRLAKKGKSAIIK